MYFDLKARLGATRALKVSACTARGIDEKDLMRCHLPMHVKQDIQLMHEKYVRGINHGARALRTVWG
jgi:hypothetical protein